MDLISDINFASSATLAGDGLVGNAIANNGVNNTAAASPIGAKNANFLNIDHLTSCNTATAAEIPNLGAIATPVSKQDTIPNGNQAANSAICDSTRFTNFLMCPDIGSQFSTVAQNSFNPWIPNPGSEKTTPGINFGSSPLQANVSSTALYSNPCAAGSSAKFDFNTPAFDFNCYNPAAGWAPLDVYSNSNMAASYQSQRNLSATALSACSPAKFAATYPSINVNGIYYPSSYATPYTRYSRNLLSKLYL